MRRYSRTLLLVLAGFLVLNSLGYQLFTPAQAPPQNIWNRFTWWWPRPSAPTPTPTPAPTPTPSPTPTSPTPPEPPTGPITPSAQEQSIIGLTNKARQDAGLGALRVNSALMNMGRLKAQDMVNNNYFNHYSPTYGYPSDMAGKLGISYMEIGENIAEEPTVEEAHAAFMKSPGHRANILDPRYTELGIGVVSDGRGGVTIAEEFVGR